MLGGDRGTPGRGPVRSECSSGSSLYAAVHGNPPNPAKSVALAVSRRHVYPRVITGVSENKGEGMGPRCDQSMVGG